MIVLWIILFLILFALLFLLLDISLVFSYKEKFNFNVRIFCFSISGSKIIEIVESREKNKDSKPIKPVENSNESRRKKKKSPSDIIELIVYIAELIKAILGEFCNYARLKLCRVKVSIATEDAAQTALIYGAASSAIYTALEFLDSFMTVKKNYKNIGVAPDFTADECRIDFKVVLKLKIIHLILAFINISPLLASAKKGKYNE